MANEKRLTEKHYNGKGYYLLCSGVILCDNKCDECEELYKAIDRLGEYEDKAEQTVDAVEVVRCFDCQHFDAVDEMEGGGYCNHPRFHINNAEPPIVYAADFCSCGERKRQ